MSIIPPLCEDGIHVVPKNERGGLPQLFVWLVSEVESGA